MNNIYEDGLGDELIKQENYNDEILSYLLEEAKIISKIILANKVIVEVGCMYGRLLKEVSSQSKEYIGIDNSKAYIKEGNEKFNKILNNRCQLILGNSEELQKIQQLQTLKDNAQIALIHPFNSFGNILNIEKAIQSISEIGLPFYIFTYQCNSYTTHTRLDYYQKSGFKNLLIDNNSKGIKIKDDLGLNSSAYTKSWLVNKFGEFGATVYAYKFGKIGILFSNVVL